MPSLMVPDLSEDLLHRLEIRAAASGRTRESEVREILEDVLGDDAAWDRFEAAAALARAQLGDRVFSNSVDDIAEGRRERDRDA